MIFTIPDLDGTAANIAAAMPIDKAIEEACKALSLPVLGGGRYGYGWSSLRLAFSCMRLYEARYITKTLPREPAGEPLQIGTIFQTLSAFDEAGGREWAVKDGGLLCRALAARAALSFEGTIKIPANAATQILEYLKGLCLRVAGPRPLEGPILEAERIWNARRNWYDRGGEDLEPLAIEWVVQDHRKFYSARYDAVYCAGQNDPMLPAGMVVIGERKSAGWMARSTSDAWFLDGEILGELLMWQRAKQSDLFGPLGGVLVDVTSKEKVPQCKKVLIPPESPALREFERSWLAKQAEIDTARVTGFFPQSFAACYEGRGTRNERPCLNFLACQTGAMR